jgi:NAD-specific glutamate dehydrogenase
VGDAFSAAFTRTLELLPKRRLETNDERLAAAANELERGRVPSDLVERLLAMERVHEALDIAQLAAESGEDVERAAAAVYLVGQNSGLLALVRSSLDGANKEDLDRPARVALRDQLRRQLVYMATQISKGEKSLTALSPKTVALLDALQKDLAPLSAGRGELSALVIAADRIDRRMRAAWASKA